MSKQWETLVEQLEDLDPKVRRKAIRRLAAIGDPAVIPHLVEAYRDPDDEKVRQAAHDALAMFKAQQQSSSARRLPLSNQMLTRIVTGLAVLFVLSLIINGLILVLGSGDDNDPNTDVQIQEPTERDVLVTQFREKLGQAQTLTGALRQQLDHYNTTNEITCDQSLQVPEAINLNPIDQKTYRDLAIVGAKFDGLLPSLGIILARWNHACDVQTIQVQELLEVSNGLDTMEPQLAEVESLLDEAIRNPAPTIGPTVTPVPTATDTPIPGTATLTPTEEPLPTELPTNTPEPTATLTPTPTVTPLPFPNLDYPTITRDLQQWIALAIDNLDSPQYDNGLLNYWRRAQEGETLALSFCTKDWPTEFIWTEEQLAQLQAPGVADPQIERTVQVYNEGLAQALEAAALYEPSCTNQTLGETAAQGILTGEAALEDLTEAQALIEEIRRR